MRAASPRPESLDESDKDKGNRPFNDRLSLLGGATLPSILNPSRAPPGSSPYRAQVTVAGAHRNVPLGLEVRCRRRALETRGGVELAIQLIRSEQVRDRLNPHGVDVYLEILIASSVDDAVHRYPMCCRREHEIIDPDTVPEEHVDRMTQRPWTLVREDIERIQLYPKPLTLATEPRCRSQVTSGVDQRFSSHRQLSPAVLPWISID